MEQHQCIGESPESESCQGRQQVKIHLREGRLNASPSTSQEVLKFVLYEFELPARYLDPEQ
jgi:hypothetical protein